MRTTVAPPATTSGIVVTPGQPMAQGIAPPMITSPAPPAVVAPAPIAPAPVAPIAPAPVAAPATMLPALQNGAKFHPPGGDYLFHQSSNQRRTFAPEADDERALAADIQTPAARDASYTVVQCGYAPPSDEPLPAPMQADGTVINPYVQSQPMPGVKGVPGVQQPDGTILNPFAKSNAAAVKSATANPATANRAAVNPIAAKPNAMKSAAGRSAPPKPLPLSASEKLAPRALPKPASTARPAPATAANPKRPPVVKPTPRLTLTPPQQPPADLSAISVGKAEQTSTLRILGESKPTAIATIRPGAGSSNQTAGSPFPMLRITASSPSLKSSLPANAKSAQADLAFSSEPAPQNSATLVEPNVAPAVVRASFQPADGPAPSGEYAHSADYQTLRGKLEYSPSLRQWKLRYIPIDGRTDAYGGSVILPESAELSTFKSGELVEVRGSLPAARISSGFAPHYTPSSIKRQAR
jgi:hypothetical protein